MGTADTTLKDFDLMFSVNVRASFACSQACLPHLRRADNPPILNLSPPLSMRPEWFRDHVAYSMSKYTMSMCVLGMAEEFRPLGVAVNALWPRSVIHTSALAMLHGRIRPENCRTPAIVADAAYAVVKRDSRQCTGNFFLDEDVLAEEGITDLRPYALSPEGRPYPDLFVE